MHERNKVPSVCLLPKILSLLRLAASPSQSQGSIGPSSGWWGSCSCEVPTQQSRHTAYPCVNTPCQWTSVPWACSHHVHSSVTLQNLREPRTFSRNENVSGASWQAMSCSLTVPNCKSVGLIMGRWLCSHHPHKEINHTRIQKSPCACSSHPTFPQGHHCTGSGYQCALSLA